MNLNHQEIERLKGLLDKLDTALFEERIRGRTEAMEWMYHLVEDFKRIAKTHEEKYPRDSYIYEECADMLEMRILQGRNNERI
jgi:hypothetical protein